LLAWPAKIVERRLSKFDNHFSSRKRQALSGANQEWHPRPPPGLNFETHGSESLDLGIRFDTFFFLVALELSANQMLRVQRGNRAEDLDGLIADGIIMQAGRCFHGQKGYDLKHVVLDHVPDRSGSIVEFPSPLNPKPFRHGDLHTFNIIPVPDGLQKTIGEAEEQQIEDRFFAEVMVNTKDPRFWKNGMKRGIQLLRRGKIVSKRLFNNYPCILHAGRVCERLDNIDKKIGRNRK
jgi:hypothetical protein